MARKVTTTELARLVRPFVGAKAFPRRDPSCKFGGYLPQTSAVDILARSKFANADVRSVTDDGIEVFFYSGCELIPWSDVRSVAVVGLDASGNRTGETVFEHAGERIAA